MYILLSNLNPQQINYKSKELQVMQTQKYQSLKSQPPAQTLNNKGDHNNTSSSVAYEYVAGLKHVGYVLGDPIGGTGKGHQEGNVGANGSIGEKFVTGVMGREGREVQRQGMSALGERVSGERSRIQTRTDNRIGSRIEYSPTPGVIVHEHPSRPVRSPSPISVNPNANIVPTANFIYNSSGGIPNTTSRIVSYSPVRLPVQQPPLTIQKPVPLPPMATQPMVPMAQFQRCVSQCRLWEQKYNELYALYLKSEGNSKSQVPTFAVSSTNNEQNSYLIKQNKKLKERVHQLERNQQKLLINMEDIITRLVNKYRDSTIKESLLLVDRYRLEKKMGQKM